MSQDSEQISTLEDLFKSDLQKPFHYKLSHMKILIILTVKYLRVCVKYL